MKGAQACTFRPREIALHQPPRAGHSKPCPCPPLPLPLQLPLPLPRPPRLLARPVPRPLYPLLSRCGESLETGPCPPLEETAAGPPRRPPGPCPRR